MHLPRKTSPEPVRDDEAGWEPGQLLEDETERRVPCVFIWLADEPKGKVLTRDNRVLVEVDDRAREKAAHSIVPEDRVILGPGSSRWSPADDFTQAVAKAAEASNPQLVRDAREWRMALNRLQVSRSCTPEELRVRLAAVDVHR